ncbi:MAG: hypothetical protein R2779_12310 [Crocinitomicaceae bacterium]
MIIAKLALSLILASGWVESMHFATSLMKNNKNDKELIDRVGEQKQTLQTLIAVLEENNKNNESDQLIQSFRDLKTSFDQILMNYKYGAHNGCKKTHHYIKS